MFQLLNTSRDHSSQNILWNASGRRSLDLKILCSRRTSIPWNRICSDCHALLWSAFLSYSRLIFLVGRRGLISGYIRQTDRKHCVKSGGESSAVGRSEGPTSSVVSAPPAGVSSSSSSFRQSTTRIHTSLASLLGRRKDHKESEPVVVKKKKTTKRGKKNLTIAESGLKDK